MIKRLIKKSLILYLNARKTDDFRQHVIPKELEEWALQGFKKIELLHKEATDTADEFWRTSQSQALSELLHDKGLMNFLRLPTIQRTMYESYAPFLIKEYIWVKRKLRKEPGEGSRFIIEDNVGNPVPFLLNSSTSGNLIHHLYHVLKFNEFLGGAFKISTRLSNLAEGMEAYADFSFELNSMVIM